MARWVVMKFGGTSVSSLASWQTIASVVRDRIAGGERPLLVCSAVSQVSNTLERLLEAARHGEGPGDIVEQLRQRHLTLAGELGVDCALIDGELRDLERLAQGVSLVREASPRVRARVMALGELMSTRMGAVYLSGQGISTAWQDARMLLTSTPGSAEERHYLSATCAVEPDDALRDRLDRLDQAVVLTQGFIAGDDAGETVLLGRGGSDTSAAYLAARLGAERLEIWTDVPGMFTANPRDIPSARLLKRLDYDEAQELATTGAKILHPRCIAPVRSAGVPLHVRSTANPELEGTMVQANGGAGAPQVKAVLARRKIALVVMESVDMWQQTGFLAEAFACFSAHDLSIDLVATSATNVTVSLDLAAHVLHPATVDSLLRDLRRFCHATYVGPTAAVTLVGTRIRAILHRLGPILERFEDQTVHLVSQAASDLSITFVVGEDQAETLVRTLHASVFATAAADPTFGPTWSELEGVPEPASIERPWWYDRRDDLLAEAEAGTPCFVYDLASLDGAVSELDRLCDRMFYAVKANANSQVLEHLAAAGVGFECVSPAELDRVLEVVGPLPADRLMFTPNFAPRHEYEHGFAAGATVTLDSSYPLSAWPEVFAGREIFVRIDPGRGHGHHPYVVTAGAQSKFGVPPAELPDLVETAGKQDVRICGLHAHTGSGSRDAGAWREKAVFLAELAQTLPDVRIIDLGGGLGVPEQSWQHPLDLARVGASLDEVRRAHPHLALWLEPGRYLVARAGVLLARVNQTKDKGARRYVGVDAGMNSFIRPALYGAWHEIVNLTRLGEPKTLVADVVGPICETGDVLGYGRHLPHTEPGDLLLLANAGAYGRAMSSQYNLREPAREKVLSTRQA
jgi:diaminopimelate decarboxylase/aspartate kinase